MSPLNVGFIDYEKAFDSIEHFVIFNALRKIGIHELCVKIIEGICIDATVVISISKMTSKPFNIKKGDREISSHSN